MLTYWLVSLIRGPVVTGRAVGRVHRGVVMVALAAQVAVAACVQVTVRVRVLVVVGEDVHPRVLVGALAGVRGLAVQAVQVAVPVPVAATAHQAAAALRSRDGDFIKNGAGSCSEH